MNGFENGKVTTGWWRGFLRQHKDELVTKQGEKSALNRSNWMTLPKFQPHGNPTPQGGMGHPPSPLLTTARSGPSSSSPARPAVLFHCLSLLAR